jgi:hypothetical protein
MVQGVEIMPPWVINPEIKRDFLRWTTVHPQPIAASLARLLTSRNLPEWIDNSLKTAEITTRYIAACSVASFAVRINAGTDGETLDRMRNPFAFGTFENIIKQIAEKNINHPLKDDLAVYSQEFDGVFNPGTRESPAYWIKSLRELRNNLGHALAGMLEARARRVLDEKKPVEILYAVLNKYSPILSLPLFVVENQTFVGPSLTANYLLLMGDTKYVIPSSIQVQNRIENDLHPYIAEERKILDLYPFLIWDAVPHREYMGLLFINGTSVRKVHYQSLDPEEHSINGNTQTKLNEILEGRSSIREDAVFLLDYDLTIFWNDEKRRRIEAANVLYGNMPWEKCDPVTLKWYADRLSPGSRKTPQNIIQNTLFGNKIAFDENEIFQMLLLFGSESEIEHLINRDIIDIRMVEEGPGRWRERLHFSKNVIQSLRIAVDAFSRTLGIDNASIDTLEIKTGGSDYIAMREALINMFIHQDYHDQRGSAQVNISKNKITFFNMGYSLISNEVFVEGGKSQARNPLIARALRLIGFAELAGSGLNILRMSWAATNRRVPVFTSNREENNFSVSLERIEFNEFWNENLGVTLTSQEAILLETIAGSIGKTVEQCVTETGLPPDEILKMLHYLTTQALIEHTYGKYQAKEHVRRIIAERGS